MGHGVVGAFGSQAQHVRGMLCVALASFGASSRVSLGTGPVTGGTGSCFGPVGA